MSGEGDISCEPSTGSLAPVWLSSIHLPPFNEKRHKIMFIFHCLCAQLSFRPRLSFPGNQRHMREVSFHVSSYTIPLNPHLPVWEPDACQGILTPLCWWGSSGETVPMLMLDSWLRGSHILPRPSLYRVLPALLSLSTYLRT